MTAPTPTEFLLARISEDEAVAREVHRLYLDDWSAVLAERRHSLSSRVLAECEAKRRIVEMAWDHLGDDEYGWGMEEAKRQILAELALPYASHPDYREEWRP